MGGERSHSIWAAAGFVFHLNKVSLKPAAVHIEVGHMSDLVAVLEAVKEAVRAGELDAQIEQGSGSLRDGFKKT